MTGDNELHCYNRGCGQKFNPNDNEKGKMTFFLEVSNAH